MIRTAGLVKRYGEVVALDGLDLVVPKGTVLGLLGPNGAGKTTAIRILTTLLEPDEGSVEVAGLDVRSEPGKVRERIGLSGQTAAVDEHLTGYENLEMVGRLYHLGRERSRARARELLDRFELSEAADRPAKTYSGGMRRRLDLAAALVAAPDVLFLTNSADLPPTQAILAGLCVGEVQVEEQTRRLTAGVTGGANVLRQVLKHLGDANIAVVDVGLHRPTLDDVFLAVTGHTAE